MVEDGEQLELNWQLFATLKNSRIIDNEKIQSLILSGADVNAKLDDISPLIAATNKSCIQAEVISTLLESGADVNTSDKNGSTPIIFATSGDAVCAHVLGVLTSAGSDVNIRDKDNNTPLMLVAERDCMHHFYTDELFTTPFSELIGSGADVNAKNSKGETALMISARHQHSGYLEMLLDAGADANAENNNGATPLNYASFNTVDPGVISTLIKAGANTDINRILLSAAVGNKNPNAITEILRNGADVNFRSKRGSTPLLFAVSRRNRTANLNVISTLIDSGASVNARNEEGRSCLMNAVSGSWMRQEQFEALPEELKNRSPNRDFYDVIATATLLLEAGAEINAKDEDGRTPLMLAVDKQYIDLVALLVNSGADVNARSTHGFTALIETITSHTVVGNHDMVSFLIDSGADVNARTGVGMTALAMAVLCKRTKIIRLLLEANAEATIKNDDGKLAIDYIKEDDAFYGTDLYWKLNDSSFK